MNYYPFHVGDYAAHTAHLDLLEDLAYRRLLDAYYLAEGPLPIDAAECARRVRMRGHVEVVEGVLREFFTLTQDGWRHKRCDAEIGRKQAKADKARNSAAMRWHGASDANAMRTHSEGNAPNSQEPIAKDTHTPRATAIDLAVAMRQAGVQANAAHPEVLALAEQGVSVETAVAACEEVRRRKPGERVPVAYVARVLESWAKRAAETRANGAQAPPTGPPSRPPTRAESFVAKLNGSQPPPIEVVDVIAAESPRRLGA